MGPQGQHTLRGLEHSSTAQQLAGGSSYTRHPPRAGRGGLQTLSCNGRPCRGRTHRGPEIGGSAVGRSRRRSRAWRCKRSHCFKKLLKGCRKRSTTSSRGWLESNVTFERRNVQRLRLDETSGACRSSKGQSGLARRRKGWFYKLASDDGAFKNGCCEEDSS